MCVCLFKGDQGGSAGEAVFIVFLSTLTIDIHCSPGGKKSFITLSVPLVFLFT